ncbi:MAG: hypothetical protein QOF79_1641 [Actinomycetota bacterium]|nr:hypothetical protein [Actinomycetota bacterium]
MSDQTPTPVRHSTPARAGTIVWGTILIVVAVYSVLTTTLGFSATTPSAVVWIVVGLGALLIVVALVVAIVRAARNGRSTEHHSID